MEKLEYFLENDDLFKITKHKRKDLYMIDLKDEKNIDWRTIGATEVGGLVMDSNSNIITRTYGKIFELDGLVNNGVMKPSGIKSNDNNIRMEKLDGHLIAISQHEGELLFTSKTEFNGRIIHQAKLWFNKNLTPLQKKTVKDLTKKNTLLFDYISPKEKNVIKYAKSELILHGILNTQTGKEIFEKHVFESIAKSIGIKTVNRFNIDHDMMERVLNQDYGENMLRGFIIRTRDGNRVSAETKAYINKERGN